MKIFFFYVWYIFDIAEDGCFVSIKYNNRSAVKNFSTPKFLLICFCFKHVNYFNETGTGAVILAIKVTFKHEVLDKLKSRLLLRMLLPTGILGNHMKITLRASQPPDHLNNIVIDKMSRLELPPDISGPGYKPAAEDSL